MVSHKKTVGYTIHEKNDIPSYTITTQNIRGVERWGKKAGHTCNLPGGEEEGRYLVTSFTMETLGLEAHSFIITAWMKYFHICGTLPFSWDSTWGDTWLSLLKFPVQWCREEGKWVAILDRQEPCHDPSRGLSNILSTPLPLELTSYLHIKCCPWQHSIGVT